MCWGCGYRLFGDSEEEVIEKAERAGWRHSDYDKLTCEDCYEKIFQKWEIEEAEATKKKVILQGEVYEAEEILLGSTPHYRLDRYFGLPNGDSVKVFCKEDVDKEGGIEKYIEKLVAYISKMEKEIQELRENKLLVIKKDD